MSELPIHVVKNRASWTKTSPAWVEPGRDSWKTSEITWGIWSVPESEVHALGDLAALRGKDVIELGCGTGYVSAWLHHLLGMKPVGVRT